MTGQPMGSTRPADSKLGAKEDVCQVIQCYGSLGPTGKPASECHPEPGVP